MNPAVAGALLVVAVAVLLALASRLRWPSSLVLLAGGALAAATPGLPDGRAIDPWLVAGLILPALLYATRMETSPAFLRREAVRGVAAGALLQLAMTLVSGAIAWAVVPGLGWTAALLLGLLTALSDTSLAQERGDTRHAPRRIVDRIDAHAIGASLVLLTSFRLLLDAAEAPPSVLEIAWTFARDLTLGVGLGLVTGAAAIVLRRRLDAGPIEIGASIATPFAAAALAQLIGGSLIVVTIVAAFTISARLVDARTGATLSSAETRLLGRQFWTEAQTMLSGALYFLTGFAAAEAMGAIGGVEFRRLALAVLLIFLATSAVQFLIGLLSSRGRPREAVVEMLLPGRATLGLLVALIVPVAAPDGVRDLALVAVALGVLLSTLLHLTLVPWALRALALGGEAERAEEARRIRDALAAAAPAGPAAQRLAVLRLQAENAIGDGAASEGQRAIDLAEAVGRANETGGLAPSASGPPSAPALQSRG